MIQLYFENQKVDLTENLEIPMTYENIDLGQPEATLNNYSKTVTIYGTPSNNKLLGSIYRFDKTILEGDSLVGVTFDPNKRVEYTLLNNGVLFDRGYFKLDKINVKNGQVSYDLTLYGGIGNFFYSLLYNEDGSDLNLGSLYYGIDGLTKNEENTKPLFEYNKDFVYEAWNKRMEPTLFDRLEDYDSKKMFCPIPTYSGYYDDFKSDTVLYDIKWLNNPAWKNEIVEDDKKYTTKKRWIKIQTPRELTEWEIGDLRSHYQRLGVRLKNIYEAIKQPENNGGFTVDDSKVQEIEKQYIENGYLMLNRFDYEDINSTYIDTTINLQLNKTPKTKLNYDFATSQQFDVSDYLNPNAVVNILPELYIDGTDIPDYIILNRGWVNGYWLKTEKGWVAQASSKFYLYLNYQYFFVVSYDSKGEMVTASDVYIYSGNSAGTDMQLDFPVQSAYNNLKKDIEASILNNVQVLDKAKVKFNYTYENTGYDLETQSTATQKRYLGKKTISIQVPLNKTSTQIRIYTGVAYGYYYRYFKDANSIKQITGNVCNAYNEKFNKNWQCTSVANISDSVNARTAIYDGDFSDEGDRHVLNKAAIFADSPSPYDFLLSLGKMFNWKFEQDILNSKIMIYSSKNYYTGITRLIEEDIDRSVYNIIPTTAEYKCYDFGHEVPDSYAKNLWNLKYNEDYGLQHLKTNYDFSKEHHNLHEDSEFKTAIPWKLTSVYFNNEQQGWPKATLGSTFTGTLWNEDDDSKDTKYTGFIGLSKIPEGLQKISQNKQDVFAKLCCFDKESSSIDLQNAIVYFDQFRTSSQESYKYYQLSDNIPICKELCDQNCYYLNYGWSSFASVNSIQERSTSETLTRLPVFSNKFFYKNENYFGVYKTPTTDINLTEDKKNIYASHNIFELCFKYQFEDLYNKNNKVLNIKYRLREHPKTAMRKFYYFDNSTWILNKIDNYTPGFNNFTNCQFIKIQDKNNYIQ